MMVKYVCTTRWVDLKDGRHLYNAGDEFPREGLTVQKSRIDLLLGSANLAGKPLIEAVPEEETPAAPKKRVRSNG